jgi:glycosyltransferase involved in cell wall biosynthesis
MTSLSVVMPVFNEAAHLPATLDALAQALDGSGFDSELVVVDDGSTDRSADVVRSTTNGQAAVRLLRQGNQGRFEARRAGLAAAEGDYVLFLDARVRLLPESLRFVRPRLAAEPVWNGHVYVEAEGALADFWRLLAELAWREYFDRPRTTSFGLEDFDHFPKGTTCFLAPRSVLEPAFAAFRSRYEDVRLANDDTPVLRSVAAQQPIHISPDFACVYSPRTSVVRFLRHAVHRGVVFVDGHGTRESRFFPFAVAFFPVSAAVVVAAVRRPAVGPAALAACSLGAVAYGLRAGRTPHELRTLAVGAPLYAVGHGLGMWRGLYELLR